MTKEDIIKPENLVAKKPTLMNDNPMHYCPGCSHGVVHKLIAEVIEEMGLEDKAVGIISCGYAVFIYNYMEISIGGSRSRTCSRTCHRYQAPVWTVWYLPTRATVIWPVSVPPKQFMR